MGSVDITCNRTDCVNRSPEICVTCKRNVKPLKDYYQAYKPTCPRGYTDCVCDPAYIKRYHPKWYASLYGELTPEEASKKSCRKRSKRDHDDCYDDEDK